MCSRSVIACVSCVCANGERASFVESPQIEILDSRDNLADGKQTIPTPPFDTQGAHARYKRVRPYTMRECEDNLQQSQYVNP